MNIYRIPKGSMTYSEYSGFCTGLPFVYNGARTLFINYPIEEVSVDGTIAGYELLPAPDVPIKPFTVSKLSFLDRLTISELTALLSASDTNSVVRVIMKRFDSASEITVNDQRTIDGVNVLIAYGLLTSERAIEILSTEA